MDIHMTDDVYRPSNSAGYPIEQNSSELAITIDGYTYDWYFTAECQYNTDKSSADDRNARIICSSYLFQTGGGTPSTPPALRFVFRIYSDHDPEHYFEEIIRNVDRFSGINSIDIHAREQTASYDITHTYGGIKNFIQIANFYLIGSLSELQNMEYNIGCKIQRNVNGTWIDVLRSGKTTPWKELTSYAPFYQSITPPSHFYGNGINRFTAPIESKFKFSYSNYEIQGRYYSYVGNKIVRNIEPPYITEGEETQYLYTCPGLSVSEREEDRYKTYKFIATLSIIDPSDSNYTIVVAQRKVTGNIEYLDTDDLSMVDTPSWTLADPTGMYERYGVLLRNVANTMIISISCVFRYGVTVQYGYYDFGKIYGSDIGGRTDAQSAEAQLIIPTTGTTTTVGAYVRALSNYIISEKITIPIIDYAVPSFPIASIHRCDEDGTANDNGAYCRIDWSVAITSINNQNSKRLSIRHPEGITDYNPLDSYTQSGQLVVAANTEQTYAIDLIVSDDLNSITKTMRLSTANVTMDWLYNGKAVSFGKVANTPESVEISETWKLICYKLLVSGVDIDSFMSQILARMDAIEQFATNLGDTGQQQVTFYNNQELLLREWVKTGESVDDPVRGSYPKLPVPEKESTPTETYSFVGWALTNGATADEANALTNITAYRSIYAAFQKAVRMYMVRYFNENAVAETINNVQYHASTTPTVTPGKSGYRFAGWMPSGKYINGNTDAKAQFYKETEISDSWSDIIQAVNDGTAMQKYEIGQYKTLNCGTYGNVKMQIKGFKIDHMPSTTKKAMISWEAMDCLPTLRRMNPSLEYTTESRGQDDWSHNIDSANGYHWFRSQWTPNPNHTGTLNATVKCTASGTFSIGYYTGRSSSAGDGENNALTIKINGTTAFNGNPGTSTVKRINATASAGSIFNVEITYKDGNTGNDQLTIRLYTPTISTAEVKYTQSQLVKLYPHEYTEGTGSFGGWAKSELRNFLNGDFYNQIDEVVRNNIKTVGKIAQSTKADTSDQKFQFVDNAESGDKVYIPSNEEIGGNMAGEYLGVDFLQTRRTKYRNGSTLQNEQYWVRTAADNQINIVTDEGIGRWTRVPGSFRYYYNYSSTTTADVEKGVCIGFCT